MSQEVKQKIVDTSFKLSLAKVQGDLELVNQYSQLLSELINNIMFYEF